MLHHLCACHGNDYCSCSRVTTSLARRISG
jgi:hypothetical protein